MKKSRTSQLIENILDADSTKNTLDSNVVDWQETEIDNENPGTFSEVERTDVGNVDINRADPVIQGETLTNGNADNVQPEAEVEVAVVTDEAPAVGTEIDSLIDELLKTFNIETQKKNDAEEVEVSVEEEPQPEPEEVKPEEETPKEEPKKEEVEESTRSFLKYTFDDVMNYEGEATDSVKESAYSNMMKKVLAESDYAMAHKWVPDTRINWADVLHALKAELPGVIGLNVKEEIDELNNPYYKVSGPDWEQYPDIDLPKEIVVEQLVLKLKKDGDDIFYIPADIYDKYPMRK